MLGSLTKKNQPSSFPFQRKGEENLRNMPCRQSPTGTQMHTILRDRNHALFMEQELQDVPFDGWMGAERSIFNHFFPVVGRDSTLNFSTIRS